MNNKQVSSAQRMCTIDGEMFDSRLKFFALCCCVFFQFIEEQMRREIEKKKNDCSNYQ